MGTMLLPPFPVHLFNQELARHSVAHDAAFSPARSDLRFHVGLGRIFRVATDARAQILGS